jgi:hypothetical protein
MTSAFNPAKPVQVGAHRTDTAWEEYATVTPDTTESIAAKRSAQPELTTTQQTVPASTVVRAGTTKTNIPQLAYPAYRPVSNVLGSPKFARAACQQYQILSTSSITIAIAVAPATLTNPPSHAPFATQPCTAQLVQLQQRIVPLASVEDFYPNLTSELASSIVLSVELMSYPML